MSTTPFSANGTRVEVTMVNNVANFRLASFRLRPHDGARDQFADGSSRAATSASGVWTTPLTVVSVAATNGVTIAYDAGAFLTSTEDDGLDVHHDRSTPRRRSSPASASTPIFNAADPRRRPGQRQRAATPATSSSATSGSPSAGAPDRAGASLANAGGADTVAPAA
jgi:hypothetical protein